MKKRTGPDYKLSISQEARVIQMYQANSSLISIARKLGVNEKTARYVLRRAEIPLRGRTGHRKLILDEASLGLLIQRYVEGASTEELAEGHGVSAGAVARRLVQVGVALRSPGFQRGDKHHAWRGGRIVNDDGYVLVLVHPDDPYYSMGQVKGAGEDGGRYVLEQRLVMARKLGRLLLDSETVHHKDLDHGNNDPSNLQLRQGKHGNGGAFRCCDCGSHNVIAEELEEPS